MRVCYSIWYASTDIWLTLLCEITPTGSPPDINGAQTIQPTCKYLLKETLPASLTNWNCLKLECKIIISDRRRRSLSVNSNVFYQGSNRNLSSVVRTIQCDIMYGVIRKYIFHPESTAITVRKVSPKMHSDAAYMLTNVKSRNLKMIKKELMKPKQRNNKITKKLTDIKRASDQVWYVYQKWKNKIIMKRRTK